MPTYQYRCKSCSYEFEEIQKFSDEALTVCPSCNKPALVRVIGGAGLVFKGTGFYQTDYKKSAGDTTRGTSTKKDSKPEAKSDSTSGSESTSGSDSKSESRKESKPSDSTSSKSGGSSES
ncbi:MAG TPA: zinc ribbon domain-containing protein [Bacteroidota bacterium]|nr:zinc ribbon domain-containing protein [Bacteroidota bacterium]